MMTSRCSQSRAGRRPVLDTLKGYEDAVASGDNAAATAIIDEFRGLSRVPRTIANTTRLGTPPIR